MPRIWRPGSKPTLSAANQEGKPFVFFYISSLQKKTASCETNPARSKNHLKKYEYAYHTDPSADNLILCGYQECSLSVFTMSTNNIVSFRQGFDFQPSSLEKPEPLSSEIGHCRSASVGECSSVHPTKSIHHLSCF